MSRVSLILSLLMMSFFVTTAHAGLSKFEEAMEALCHKQKQCLQSSLASEKTEALTPEMQQMLEDMVFKMCDGVRQRFLITPQNGFPLINEATACIQSMSAQSCTEIESGNETKACEIYETLADEQFE